MALLAAAAFCESVFAATGNLPGQRPAAGGLFVGLAIAYLSRRWQIGGWLLYFYMSLFLSLLLMCGLTLPVVVSQMQPSAWADARLYVWYLLSTVPFLAALMAEIAIAGVLLFRRNEATLRLLRLTQVVLVVASSASLAIDIAYFNETSTVFLDSYSLFFSVVWTLYFRKSSRVQKVFVERSWNYKAQQKAKHVPTEAELRYLWKRAGVSAGAVFVVFLIMMGSALQDKRPDVGIFYVPLFYAVIAGLMGRYLPIRRKKRDALNARATANAIQT